jgi:hypothetical protein
MKQEQLITLMDMITNYYERFTVTEDRFSAWWEILKDYEFELCKKNLIRHASDSAFVPTIADLIKGHRDTSRTYADRLVDNIDKPKDIEEIFADIERRTGMKVVR